VPRCPGEIIRVQVLAHEAAAMLATLFAAGFLDQDTPHSFGRSGEEMAPALPARVAPPHQSNVRLVDKRSRLVCSLSRLTLGRAYPRQGSREEVFRSGEARPLAAD